MGQQQLLLIVLGVIIVGVAVVVGINLFNANAKQSVKDQMANIAINYVSMMYQHFLKPKSYGGGERTMDGWVPTDMEDSTPWVFTPGGGGAPKFTCETPQYIIRCQWSIQPTTYSLYCLMESKEYMYEDPENAGLFYSAIAVFCAANGGFGERPTIRTVVGDSDINP